MKISSLVFLSGMIVFFTSCKKDVPGYCTEEYFQDGYLTDAQGMSATAFGVGSTINFNETFTCTSSDSVTLNYSEPLVLFEVLAGAEVIASNHPGVEDMNTLKVGPGQTIDTEYPFTQTWGGLPAGSYKLRTTIGKSFSMQSDMAAASMTLNVCTGPIVSVSTVK